MVYAFLTPISGTLIIQFTDDDAENEAVEELVKLHPNAVVLNYGSFKLDLLLFRFYGTLFIVGHGSNEGIMDESGLVTWDTINQISINSPARFVGYVSCYSFEAAQLAKTSSFKQIVGLKGEVEAILAARIMSVYASGAMMELNNFHRNSILVQERYVEIQSIDEYNTLAICINSIDGYSTNALCPPPPPPSPSCYDVNHWKNIAQNRLPSAESNQDDYVQRGLAISGSYADLYLSNPDDFFWTGMAAHVSTLSVVSRETAIQVKLGGFSNILAIIAAIAIITALVFLIFAVTLLIAAIIAAIVVITVYIIVSLILGGWGINGAANNLFNFMTDVNEGIYDHAAWAHFAYNYGGYDCVDELVTASNTKGYLYFKNHFWYLEYGSSVTGVKQFFISEQREFAQDIYDNYDRDLISAIEGQIEVSFGDQNGRDTTHKWNDDMPNGDLFDGQDRTDWSNNFLVPTFKNYAWKTSDTADYMNEFIQNGKAAGGNY